MRRILFALVLVVAMAGVAGADIGTISMTWSHVNTGPWDVDLTMTGTTTGATTPQPNDWFMLFGQLYYPYTWNTAHSLFVSDAGANQSGRSTNGGFPFSRTEVYSLTAPDEPGGTSPTPGLWAFYVAVIAVEAGGTTWTTTVFEGPVGTTLPWDPGQPTPTPSPVVGRTPVPTLSMPALFFLGAIILGVGVLILRRS